jgi:hypothetical protein
MRYLAVVLVALLAMTASEASAQVGATTDILRGRVLDENGEPLRGALVEAWSAQSGVRRATTSDVEGRYTLLFPDGGGRFRLRVSMVGREPYEAQLARVADEEVLLHEARLRTRPVEVSEVVAQGRRTQPPGRGEAGTTSRGIGGDLANRLPLESTDPASIAALAPNVVGTAGADSLGGGGGFSIAGQRASQNQVTLDGATFASMLSGAALGGGLGLPQEGMRSTQVITNTYDVARGQFSGGQVAMTTQGGGNTRQGSLSGRHGGDALQAGVGRTDWNDGFTSNRISGGLGGPLIRDQLFYNLSFAAQRRADGMFALDPRSVTGYAAIGADPDSVARFRDILAELYGVPYAAQAGPYQRTGTGASGLVRLDYQPGERHSLSVRGFASGNRMRRGMIRPLDALENAGEMEMGGRGFSGSVTSRLGGSWVNEARASYTAQAQEMASLLELPEARVRVAGADASGGTGISTLAFGGDPIGRRETREGTLELANELSFLLGDAHRLKLGGVFNWTGFRQEGAFAANGVFSFDSLDDLALGRPSAYSRLLSSGPVEGSGWNAALYLGDTWRPIDRLQLVYGLRGEASGFGDAPAARPEAMTAFGLDTGYTPTELHVSPRLGFSWRLSPDGAPLRLLRGGFGEFRGRTPYSLYAGVLDAARADGGAMLSCVGPAQVPVPDFTRFRQDAASIPTRCADGSGVSVRGLPSLTGFAAGFQSPRSWRGSLGLQSPIARTITGALDATYSRGVAQYGVRDLNLAAQPAFALAGEGRRPVYAPATAIDPASGGVALAASRRDPAFGHAYEVHSDLASRAASLTASVNGLYLPRRASFQAAYTLAYAWDESSFTFGGAPEGFARTATGGDPNAPLRTAGDMDRRHSLTGLVGVPIGLRWELSLIGRAASGMPYTPMVAGDVNGDGVRNDAAFVFDPAAAGDPALAAGMARLLDGGPAGARGCLSAQLGRVAERNSCRGPWSHSLDLRLAHTPTLGAVGRRFSVGLDVYNLAAGADLALHGSAGARGWGAGGMMVDRTLLHTRGFEPESRAFRYEVNERFGQSLSRAYGMRSPFGVQLSARLALGPDRGFEPLGGFAGLGMGAAGGGGTRMTVMLPGGGGAPTPGAGGGIQLRAGAGGAPRSMADMLLPMPLDEILERADSLGLSEEQRERVREIREELVRQNAQIRLEVNRTMTGAMGGGGGNPQALFERIGPRINEGRQNVQRALERVQEVLTPEQWEQLPPELRQVGSGQVRVQGS